MTVSRKDRIRVSAAIRIGLLGDSPADARLISGILEESGRGQFILASVFSKPAEAIRWLRDSGDSLEVVLLDLSRSGPRRIEIFRRIAQTAPRLPLIVLSGNEEEELATQAIQEGAQDFLFKSDMNGRSLVRAITHAIERKRTSVELAQAKDELERHAEERTRELQESNLQLAQALDQLGETQSRMIQQERLHALERMAGGIAHDFNNALSPILAHTEWLMTKPDALRDRESLLVTLAKIHDSAEHCAEVVNRLREFYRPRDEMGRFGPLSLRRIVEDMVSLTQPYWKDQALARGVTIRVETKFENAAKVMGAKPELLEMLTNLMLNAIDAIKENGIIRASVFEEDRHPCVRISDNGVGMTEEVGARCMEPFFTTKQELGSGLGLGVVYGIAQRHDAEITIESEVGVGTDVTVRFPVDKAPVETEDAFAPVKGLRVLVAEDEPMIREVLAVYLEEDTHRVETAADGAEALRKLRSGKYDLLITDHSMPEVSGDRVAEEARVIDPGLRILMLTGFGNLMGFGAEAQSHVDALIPKPFTFESLRRGIVKALSSGRR